MPHRSASSSAARARPKRSRCTQRGEASRASRRVCVGFVMSAPQGMVDAPLSRRRGAARPALRQVRRAESCGAGTRRERPRRLTVRRSGAAGGSAKRVAKRHRQGTTVPRTPSWSGGTCRCQEARRAAAQASAETTSACSATRRWAFPARPVAPARSPRRSVPAARAVVRAAPRTRSRPRLPVAASPRRRRREGRAPPSARSGSRTPASRASRPRSRLVTRVPGSSASVEPVQRTVAPGPHRQQRRDAAQRVPVVGEAVEDRHAGLGVERLHVGRRHAAALDRVVQAAEQALRLGRAGLRRRLGTRRAEPRHARAERLHRLAEGLRLLGRAEHGQVAALQRPRIRGQQVRHAPRDAEQDVQLARAQLPCVPQVAVRHATAREVEGVHAEGRLAPRHPRSFDAGQRPRRARPRGLRPRGAARGPWPARAPRGGRACAAAPSGRPCRARPREARHQQHRQARHTLGGWRASSVPRRPVPSAMSLSSRSTGSSASSSSQRLLRVCAQA